LKGKKGGRKCQKTFVENNTEKLKNDVILISDTGMISNQQPLLQLTGLSYEVSCKVNIGFAVNQSRQNDCFASRRKQSYYHSWFYDNVEELSLEERLKWQKPFAWKIKKSTRPKDVYGEG
jgi:hypothetical protein